MLEGSPPDPAESSAEVAVTDPPQPPAEDESVASTERTPEQIEAIWKNRVAGKDRAHAAQVAELERQRDEAIARAERRAADEAAEQVTAEQWRERAETAERERDAERQARALEVRQARFPLAAEALDEATLAGMDEAKLAALNARLQGEGETTPTPPPPIDPNAAPRRSSAPPTGPREKSVGELEAELERLAPGWVDQTT